MILTHGARIYEFENAWVFVFSGCPSSCKCDEFGEGQSTGKRVLVTGEDLLTVPTDLPANTGAV